MPAWNASEIELWVTARGPAATGSQQVAAALERATSAWNEHADAIGAPRLSIKQGARYPSQALQDGVSAVLLRTDAWCPPGARDEEEGCYDHARQAITHLYVGADKTTIVEADVEVNGVKPQWLLSTGEVSAEALQALLVHELGHVLGLDHSCGLRMTLGPSAADDLNSCSGPDARGSVMYPDPLEKGREYTLAPSADALSQLEAKYGGTKSGGGVSLGAILGLVLVLVVGLALACLAAFRRRAKVSPT
jgi:hypothetical protein